VDERRRFAGSGEGHDLDDVARSGIQRMADDPAKRALRPTKKPLFTMRFLPYCLTNSGTDGRGGAH
jgi:hypothetical protein